MNLLNKLHKIKKDEIDKFLPVTKAVIAAAWQKNITVYQIFPQKSFLLLAKGPVKKWFYAGRTSDDNRAAAALARNKYFTKEFLTLMNIPVPEGRVVSNEKTLLKSAKILGYPLVVKPLNGQEGKAVMVNIKSEPILLKAFRIAKRHDKFIMVEKYCPGIYYRILVIDRKYFAAARAVGAKITGDGQHSIAELVKIKNCDPQRAEGSRLQKIKLNIKARRLLIGQGLSSKSIPAKGKKVILSFSGADSGEWIDATNSVHLKNKLMFNQVARALDLNLAGIDFISPDISKPYNKNGGVINEINSAPDISLHLQPTKGKPRNAARAIITMLFK